METVLISGHGDLPVLLASRLKSTKASFAVYSLKGFENVGLNSYSPKILEFEKLGSFIKGLKSSGARRICLAGNIKRPILDSSLVDNDTLPLIPLLTKALKSGDDKALRLVISLFESAGLEIVGAHEICPELLISEGLYSNIDVNTEDYNDIKRAKEVLAITSSADVGQCCVISSGQVLCIETIGGTDRMIESLSLSRPAASIYDENFKYCRDLLLPNGGVLYKTAKDDQDLRFDMPVIGPQTFLLANKNGLKGLVIKANRVMVLDIDRCISLVNSLGLFFLVIK